MRIQPPLRSAAERSLALGHFRWQPELTVCNHGCLRQRPAWHRALNAAFVTGGLAPRWAGMIR